MAQHLTKLILFFWLALAGLLTSVQASPFDKIAAPGRFLPADQAFSFDFSQHNERITLNWTIAPGYYLYQHQLTIEPQNGAIASFELPAGNKHTDNFYGETVIYTQSLSIPLTLTQVENGAILVVRYQGCAQAGFCYPPEIRNVPLDAMNPNHANQNRDSQPIIDPVKPNAASALPFSPLWALLIGILAAATPCVLPMYPLISSLILGGQQRRSMRQTGLLAFIYVQGMALAYTALGVLVAALGLQFQAYFQHPAVLIGLSALFILLALSMFGVFSLQLPASMQTKVIGWSNKQQRGSWLGVFIMGALAGLITSPCTTAPLTAILLYIAQSGNRLAGGGTLYLYAFGMGIPLILVTLFGNKILPRSGVWMEYVKQGFGFLILTLPVILLSRVYGDVWELRMWSALGLAFFGWAFLLSLRAKQSWMRAIQVLLIAAMLIISRPLQDWAFNSSLPLTQTENASLFKQIANSQDLHQAIAQSEGNIVMLDLYADWCVACKEFEKYTFSNPAVQQELSTLVLLQADVTANSAQHIGLLKELQVLGLPSILFFDRNGQEITALRIAGFMNANDFIAHLARVKHYNASEKSP